MHPASTRYQGAWADAGTVAIYLATFPPAALQQFISTSYFGQTCRSGQHRYKWSHSSEMFYWSCSNFVSQRQMQDGADFTVDVNGIATPRWSFFRGFLAGGSQRSSPAHVRAVLRHGS